jgi:hypothetical protein
MLTLSMTHAPYFYFILYLLYDLWITLYNRVVLLSRIGPALFLPGMVQCGFRLRIIH